MAENVSDENISSNFSEFVFEQDFNETIEILDVEIANNTNETINETNFELNLDENQTDFAEDSVFLNDSVECTNESVVFDNETLIITNTTTTTTTTTLESIIITTTVIPTKIEFQPVNESLPETTTSITSTTITTTTLLTQNETLVEADNIDIINQKANETQNQTVEILEVKTEPNLNLEAIEYWQDDNLLYLSSRLVNNDNETYDVWMNWSLPEGISIVEGESSKLCNDSECFNNITLSVIEYGEKQFTILARFGDYEISSSIKIFFEEPVTNLLFEIKPGDAYLSCLLDPLKSDVQSFRINETSIVEKISLYIAKNGDDNSLIKASIWTNSSAQPGEKIVDNKNEVYFSDLSDDYSWVDFTFNVGLEPDIDYWIILEYTNSSTNRNWDCVKVNGVYSSYEQSQYKYGTHPYVSGGENDMAIKIFGR